MARKREHHSFTCLGQRTGGGLVLQGQVYRCACGVEVLSIARSGRKPSRYYRSYRTGSAEPWRSVAIPHRRVAS